MHTKQIASFLHHLQLFCLLVWAVSAVPSDPPEITFYKSSYTVNETSNVSMVCRAKGVPQPRIIWTWSGSSKVLAYGEQFLIVNTTRNDDGTYRCTARNEIWQQDSKDVILNVQVRPFIVTFEPTTTQIPGTAGERVDLTCTAVGKPPPSLSWKRDLNATSDLSSLNDGKVNSITKEKYTNIMKVTVTNVGEKFYCIAVNLLGSDNQQYTIRERGVPDAPFDVKLVAFKVEGAKTVSVRVRWTPGYSGGYDQVFTIHYRVKGSGANFVEQSVRHPYNNRYTIQGLLPETDYEFTVQASNQAGKGVASTSKQVKTPESSVPPDRGSVKAARMADDATVILVTWTVTDKNVTTLNLEMRGEGESQWEPVPGASALSKPTTKFKVTDVNADKSYRFRLDMRRPEEQHPVYVYSGVVWAPSTGMNSTIYKKDVRKGGLSSGALSGIVIGLFVAVIVAGLAAAYVLWLKKQGNKRNRRRKTEPRFSVFGNEGTAELELHSSAFPRAERGLANLTYVSDETTEEKTRTRHENIPTDQAEHSWHQFCYDQGISVGLMQVLAGHQIKTESLLARVTEQDLSDMKLVVGQKIILRRVIERLSKSTGDNPTPPMATSMEEVTSSLHPFKLQEEPANIKVLRNTNPIPVPEQVTRPETRNSSSNLTGPEGGKSC